ncbi:tetratricopeptide repeat-containing sensor histidine kinase [bacterium]|nr:tetratricopeptide repeat-containing sensor histidine kinase [bacterium]
MKKKAFVILFLLLPLLSHSMAEEGVVVLLSRWDTAATVTIKLRVLDQLSRAYYPISPYKADSIARSGLALALRHDYPAEEAMMHYCLAKTLRLQGQYAKALLHLEVASDRYKTIASEDQDIKIRIILVQQEIGNVYLRKGNMKQAFKYLDLAQRELFYLFGNKDRSIDGIRGDLAHDLGKAYEVLEAWADAERHYQESKELYESFEVDSRESFGREKGNVFGNLSRVLSQKRNLEEAFEYLNQQRIIMNGLGDPAALAETYLSSGDYYKVKNQLAPAEEAYVNALNIFRKRGEKYKEAETYLKLGDLFRAQAQWEEAQSSYEKAVSISGEIGAKYVKGLGLRRLSLCFQALGKWEPALKSYQEYKAIVTFLLSGEHPWKIPLESSLANISPEIEYLELQQKYQSEQLRRAKLINHLALGGLICIGFFLMLSGIIFKKEEKAHKKLAIQNKKLLLEVDLSNKKVAQLTHSEMELQSTNATKNKLFSILSHDLRGQMGGIAAFSKILSEQADTFTREQFKGFAGKLHRSSSGLFQLFENLLQWSKAQSHELEYKPEIFSLQTIFSHNLALHEIIAKEKRITLSSDVEEFFLLKTDKNMLDFVLRNLLSNAIKFTYPKGTVRLEAGKDKLGYIVIRVVDTGMGISKEVQKNLFDKDHHPTTYGTGNEKGTGLGLLLCSEFLEKMGSSLQFLTAPGQGTTFYFTLPECKLSVS